MKNIKEKLTVQDTANVVIENSNWNKHTLEGYGEELTIYSEDFNANKEKTIQYYLDNEGRFHSIFMETITRMLEFKDFYDYNFDDAFQANEIELPETVTNNWLKKNVKLIGIRFLIEKKGIYFLEFDFAVSWDEEHGMVAKVYKDSVIDIAEGGICW